jgi:neutral ceramidase
MGASFAAGTTDGPGTFPFQQGATTTDNPLWNVVAATMTLPTPEDEACQAPKPILLPTGRVGISQVLRIVWVLQGTYNG